METKEAVILQEEKIVKNILSVIYNIESIELSREQMHYGNGEEPNLELSDLKSQCKRLSLNFEKLRLAENGNWDDLLEDYKYTLKKISNTKIGILGDMNLFIDKISIQLEKYKYQLQNNENSFPKHILSDKIRYLSAHRIFLIEKLLDVKYTNFNDWDNLRQWFQNWKNSIDE